MQVENSLLAPNIVFANIHNDKGKLTNTKKIVAVPVSTDVVHGKVGTLTETSGSLGVIVRGNHFNEPVYSGLLRVPLLRLAFAYLMKNTNNPYTVRDEQAAEDRRRQLDAFCDERSLLDIDRDLVEPDAANGLAEDAVERNRNSLPFVGSVFLPDGTHAPGSESCPVNFLEMLHPYVTTMPMFFPHGRKGLHDPSRMIQPTEGEFVLHYLRNVRKELLEFPLFTFVAAYRLETNRLISCFHSLRGFFTNDTDEVSSAEDDRLRFMRMTGSADYYQKQYLDMKAKSMAFGYPEIFYTWTNTDRWEVTLASCLLQDGHDVWHTADETDRLTLLPEKTALPSSLVYEYALHQPRQGCSDCPYHTDCRRLPVGEFMTGDQKKKLLHRNLYTVNRIFDQRARSLVANIVKSDITGLNVRAFHDVKEFGDVSGWAHVHGVAWRRMDETKSIFAKLHSDQELTEQDKQDLSKLAESVVCVRLRADRIGSSFPDLKGTRAEDVARLVAIHQCHVCTMKCQREYIDGCWYNFPRLPSGLTLIAAPPSRTLDKDAAKHLVAQCKAVKAAVQEVLTAVTADSELSTISLLHVLDRALGAVEEVEDQTGFRWAGGVFPQGLEGSHHSVDRWKAKLAEPYGNPGPEVLNVVAVYYAALATSCSLHHQLVSRRAVAEVWVEDYNPYCLEAMRSNMAVKLIMSTPDAVLHYVTKAAGRQDSQTRIVAGIKQKNVGVTAQKVADRADQMREVCQSEAFFRIDKNMHLSDTNVTTAWVNSAFPDQRGSTYVRVEGQGIDLPNRPGQYRQTSRIEDKYQRK